jgi:hypothetical protein
MENKEVQFDEPKYRIPTRHSQHNLFIDFLIKRGWAKDERQVIYILLGVLGVCILIIVWFLSGGGYENVKPNDFVPAV